MKIVQGALNERMIALEPEEMAMVRQALGRHIPDHRVWAFGSRATGRHLKRFSDLDLAVEGSLSSKERYDLGAELDESDLPMKVDLVELAVVDASFRVLIEPDFVLVQEPLRHANAC